MSDPLLDLELPVRAAVFVGLLLALALWELAAPGRRREIPRLLRWTNNLALVVLDAALIRVAFPVVALGMAVLAADRDWGLLNAFSVPGWLAVAIAILALDLAIYFQHVLFHAVPLLWRLHRMHHADLEFDVTTGIRFHSAEVLLSMGRKLGVVAALGAPPLAVLIFEVALNASSLFNHANIALPRRLDALLRLVVVTPDMHRVHHSVHPSETKSNFGFNLPWWDRLFGTYTAQPRDGHERMTIGLSAFRSLRDLWLDRMLLQPFRGGAGRYPLHHEPGGDRNGGPD